MGGAGLVLREEGEAGNLPGLVPYRIHMPGKPTSEYSQAQIL